MELTDKEVFSKIWIYPRLVFQFIDKTGYKKYFSLLLIISGVISALQRRLDKGLEQNEVVSALFFATLFGALFGWIGTYVYASLIRFTGEWLHGKAGTYRIFRMIGYANIPFVCSIVIHLIQLYLIKYDYLELSFSENEQMVIYYGLMSIKTILTIWTLVLCTIGIAEVQEFSILKAILNLILPIIIFLVPLGILYLIATSLR